MDSNLQLFAFEGSQVRALEIKNEPWFVGKDVAEILGYAEPRRAVIQHVDKDDRKSLGRKDWGDLCPNLWANPYDFTNKAVVNESGVYALIFGSKMPNAKRFKHWVTSEVLPAIRKHGAYMTDEKAFNVVHNKNGLADLLQQAADQLKQKDIQIEEMKPKAMLADAITASETSILVGEMAKILKKNGVNTGQNRFFKWLRENGYLIKRKGTDYNMPTQKSMNLKLFEIKEKTIVDGNSTRIVKTPKITGNGQQYFTNLFLS